MALSIKKELFQREKNRVVYVDDNEIFCVQFFNQKSKIGPEVPVVNGKAKIPNELLKESLPIVALACCKDSDETQVVERKIFKVLSRAKPDSYVDDIPGKEVIYDGGEET